MRSDDAGKSAGDERERRRENAAATINQVLRIAVLVLSGGAMVVGIVIAAGWVQIRNLPEQFRVVMGVVVVLYGMYRFVLTYIQMRRR